MIELARHVAVSQACLAASRVTVKLLQPLPARRFDANELLSSMAFFSQFVLRLDSTLLCLQACMQGSTGTQVHAGHTGAVTTEDISEDGYSTPSASAHRSCCIRWLQWGIMMHKLEAAGCDHCGTVGTSQPAPDCACIHVMCTLAGSFCAFAMHMASIWSR